MRFICTVGIPAPFLVITFAKSPGNILENRSTGTWGRSGKNLRNDDEKDIDHIVPVLGIGVDGVSADAATGFAAEGADSAGIRQTASGIGAVEAGSEGGRDAAAGDWRQVDIDADGHREVNSRRQSADE